jgi:hypothetical protein
MEVKMRVRIEEDECMELRHNKAKNKHILP